MTPARFRRMSNPNERLKARRSDRGFTTAKEAAEAFGWPLSTYTQHENGTRPLSRKAAERYAAVYGVSAGWLLYGEKDARAARDGPQVRFGGVIGAGQIVYPHDDIAASVSAVIGSEDGEAFEIVGDSMMPLAHPGDYVFFGLPRAPRDLIGRECIVELVDGKRLFKKLERGSRSGLYTLLSYNAEDIRDVEVVNAGPLLGVKRQR
ncbi:HTH cro/C1-type domain-containing protein [Hyphomicrobiales bacterium]|nr:HTH cro/C1-type domain-containing protein [Hyphomicrobiales bacterium]CAH1667829.1 HTH cro/C1-type domain-containing protein [Hyphomicrobiales bacterium]